MNSNEYFSNLIFAARKWAVDHDFQLAIFNIAIVLLVLLRSAGYFEPFFPITINLIVLTSLFLSILLLNARSSFMFIISLIFWIFAGFLKVMSIDTWAERTVVYSFESFSIGILLLIVESINLRKTDLQNSTLFLRKRFVSFVLRKKYDR